jgi:hypothetical protein
MKPNSVLQPVSTQTQWDESDPVKTKTRTKNMEQNKDITNIRTGLTLGLPISSQFNLWIKGFFNIILHTLLDLIETHDSFTFTVLTVYFKLQPSVHFILPPFLASSDLVSCRCFSNSASHHLKPLFFE